MILYFSGTGNSRHAAEKLAELTGDEAKPLAEGFRAEKPRAVNSKNPLVFVCPVHYGKLPRIVAEFIEKTPFTGKRLQPIRRTKKESEAAMPRFSLCYTKRLRAVGSEAFYRQDYSPSVCSKACAAPV